MPTVKETIEHLQQYYKSEDVIAYDLWQVDDVKAKAHEMRKRVTKKQAQEMLEEIHHHADATIGITWDTIENEIESFGSKIQSCEDCNRISAGETCDFETCTKNKGLNDQQIIESLGEM